MVFYVGYPTLFDGAAAVARPTIDPREGRLNRARLSAKRRVLPHPETWVSG